MTARRKKVGGARPGAGRPALADARTVRREVVLLVSEAAAHDAARGDQSWSEWIREAGEMRARKERGDPDWQDGVWRRIDKDKK